MAAKITLCKTCGKEISSKAKTCPHCGGKNKTAIYKKPWFWIIVFIFLIGLIGASSSADTGTEPTESANSSHTTEKGVTTTEKANIFSGDCGKLHPTSDGGQSGQAPAVRWGYSR